MTFDGYHHIGLPVKEMQRSLAFYTDGMGGKVTGGFPMGGDTNRMAYFVDLGGNAVVELLPTGTGAEEKDAHWAHIALRTDDTRAAYAKALAAGARTRSEPSDVMLGEMNVCGAFVYGPDGEVIEFFQIN